MMLKAPSMTTYYQTRDNASQIEALEKLAAETRQLIDNIIETAADANSLDQVTKQLSVLNSQLQALRSNKDQGRPLDHFNFKAAINEPQEILPYSPVTGSFNPIAPKLNVTFDATTQILSGNVVCSRAYEGPPGMVHGAVIAAIYDQMLAMTSTCIGKGGHTAFLNTQFLKPTFLYQPLSFTSWIDKIEGRKIFIKGQCTLDGEIISTADALCIEHRR